MIVRACISTCAAAVMLCSIAGCSDKPMVYKQGSYQGKPDSKPWDNSVFNGNQVEWDKAIRARNQSQDEYSRMPAGGK
jgi:hypothetical protein